MSRATAATPRAERRRQELEQRREQRREHRAQKPNSLLRSPMVLFTLGAVLIGAVIVGFMLITRPAAPSVADLKAPTTDTPAGVVIDGRTMGSADAKVTVDIWSDFQCPACMNFSTKIEPLAINSYILTGKVRFVYHDAAFQGAKAHAAYDESIQSAAAARCAADQGRFWPMHDWLFANWNGENQGAFTADRLRAIASAAGLDLTAYDSCMAVGDKQSAASAETASAVAAGINSTPTLIINGQTFAGSPQNYPTFAMMLDQAIAAAK